MGQRRCIRPSSQIQPSAQFSARVGVVRRDCRRDSGAHGRGPGGHHARHGGDQRPARPTRSRLTGSSSANDPGEPGGTGAIDLSAIDFEALAKRFATATRKNVELEQLRAAVRKQLDANDLSAGMVSRITAATFSAITAARTMFAARSPGVARASGSRMRWTFAWTRSYAERCRSLGSRSLCKGRGFRNVHASGRFTVTGASTWARSSACPILSSRCCPISSPSTP